MPDDLVGNPSVNVVKLYQEVHTAQNIGATSPGTYLYERELLTPFVPDEGDEIHAEEGMGALKVRRRYWFLDGSVHLEMVPFHVDPNEQMQKHCNGTYRVAWWTDRDGDIHKALERDGWTKRFGSPARAAS